MGKVLVARDWVLLLSVCHQGSVRNDGRLRAGQSRRILDTARMARLKCHVVSGSESLAVVGIVRISRRIECQFCKRPGTALPNVRRASVPEPRSDTRARSHSQDDFRQAAAAHRRPRPNDAVELARRPLLQDPERASGPLGSAKAANQRHSSRHRRARRIGPEQELKGEARARNLPNLAVKAGQHACPKPSPKAAMSGWPLERRHSP
jgi:hypothetical protein